jgi:hypothetical protein
MYSWTMTAVHAHALFGHLLAAPVVIYNEIMALLNVFDYHCLLVTCRLCHKRSSSPSPLLPAIYTLQPAPS